jgi:hypothetical protein
MGSPEEPPATPNEGPEVSAARIERERDRLLGVLLSAPPDPRTNTRKKKPQRRGRRRGQVA